MKKLCKYMVIALLALMVSGCSKESQIEGLIATSPTIVNINTDVTTGAIKTIPVIINNVTVNIEVRSTLTNSGTTQVRYCAVNILNSMGLFTATTGYLNKAEINTELSTLSYVSPGGYLVYTTNAPNNTTYNYVNTNGIKYGNSYFIPVKFVLNGSLNTAQFAYIAVTVATDKVTINKIVYNKVGSLKVGEE